MLAIPELIKIVSQNIRCIDAATAFKECHQENGIMIDVREPAEVLASAIEGSINIPRGVLEMKIAEFCPSVDTAIYIHCASGARAALAAEQLQRVGYKKVTAISCAIDVIHQAQEKTVG